MAIHSRSQVLKAASPTPDLSLRFVGNPRFPPCLRVSVVNPLYLYTFTTNVLTS
jgi:hypothetical protein